MASPEEPVGKASATKPSQIQVIQEILPSISDLKEMMLANGFSGQDSAPQPLEGITGSAVNRLRNSEDLNELGDKSNAEDNMGPKDIPVESTRKNKEKRKLSSQTVVLPDQQTLSSDSSAWVSETEEFQNIQPRGRSKSRGNSLSNGASQTNSKKVQKLSPTRLGELLHDTPTTFSIQPSSQDQVPPLMSTVSVTSPTRHRSITNPTTTPNGVKGSPFARPQLSALDRTLSAPTGMRRSKSFPRALQLDTQSSPSRPPQLQQHQHGKSVEKGGNLISPQRNAIHSIKTLHSNAPSSHLSPKSASTPSARNSTPNRRDFNSPLSGHAPTTTHLLKSATPTPSSFPPLPLQTYLSLALSSPTSHAKPTTFPSPREPGPTPSTSTHYPPQHHPDDSAAIAFERITNFLLLPGKLEGALWFGMLACLDSWLYMFTILPLRFVRALGVLFAFWWGGIKSSLSWGKGSRQRSSSSAGGSEGSSPEASKREGVKGKRVKIVSDLQPTHKADILRGLVVFTSCWILMRFDASRMYHSIRGQNGIKLYVIYNMLEVCIHVPMVNLLEHCFSELFQTNLCIVNCLANSSRGLRSATDYALQ